MNYIGGRHDRILAIYNNLLEGNRVNVRSAAEFYGTSTKTIKRDIEDIRNFLSEKALRDGGFREVIYDRSADNYYITGSNKLTAKELFAVVKVLLESRAFCREEFMSVTDKIIEQCAFDKDAAHIRDMVSNEKYHYREPGHKKKLIETVWEISNAIREHKKLKISYERLTEPRHKERVVEPVGIMFSDYYFYLTAFIPEKHTQNPTIYRIDRLTDYKILDEKFIVPYSNRFEEGEFRKRVQFMYGGDLLRIELKYTGESIESVLDRLPTAEVIEKGSDSAIIRAEVFGRGIKPWILSQADRIEVLKPRELRDEMKELINSIADKYK